MKLTSVLLAALLLASVPTHALSPMRPALERSQALYALNAMQVSGMEFGRFFDAAALRSSRLVEHAASSLPERPASAARAAGVVRQAEPTPFIVEIPRIASPPFQRTFRRLMKKSEKDGYDEMIFSQAMERGLDPRLVKSVIAAESEFMRRAKSPAGALGLMQVRPATAEEMGVSRTELFDPAANIRAGTRYLSYLFERARVRYHLKGVSFVQIPEWVIQRVIAAYNAGPRWIMHRPLYRQTREYVRKVLMYYRSQVSEIKRR